ncbi:hypothetical protein HFD88_001007 [Aspergillus terreus]|nr:hypothetical protein HFD88_001007 [Aspergillus terreus]
MQAGTSTGSLHELPCGQKPGQVAPVPQNENRTTLADIPDAGDSLGEAIVSPANSSANSEHLNQDIWTVSQSLSDEAVLGAMSEFPVLDFLLDSPDGCSAAPQNAPSPTSREMNVEEHGAQPHFDSAIDLSDYRSISPTQQPARAAEHSTKTGTHGLNEATRQRTRSVPAWQTSPMTRSPCRQQCFSNDSKGAVIAAAEIVEQLEERMGAGLSAIDDVLRVNKEATQRISGLINSTKCTSSIGGSIVVVAAAHHVVCLFEEACRRANGPFPAPGIGFGSFLLDPQEQTVFRAQIISIELHRSLRMVQSLSMPLQTGCFGPDPACLAMDGWLQDLKRRLRSLISVVESSERSWAR